MEKLIDFDRKMEKTEKKKYPIGPEHYTLYEEIGHGVSASVHRALCMPLNDVVAVKILDCERDNVDLNNISREAQTMILVDHPNVLKSHCSFVADHTLWVVMPYMAGGSCLHILKAAHPDGFEEVIIATILREVLRGLEYLHQHGHIHRDVKAGNILIDSHGTVKLGDFGVSACLFESGDRQRMRNTFVGTPCWMAPEVMEQLHGYDCKADIWSFGITALELAHGHAPFSKYPPMKVLLMTLQNAPPGLDYERDRKFSKSFKQMIASCLVKDPSKRPSAKKLLKHSFFKQARSNDYLLRILLEGLPALGERVKALKKKEEYLLAQKKMPDGEKEELSQNEYKRGISSWNFDLEDVKAQASLIPDDDTVFDKDQGGSSFKMDNPEKQLEHQFSAVGNITQTSDAEENEQIAHQPSPVSLVPSPSSCTEMIFEKSDDIASISCSNHDQTTSKYSPPESQRGNAELGDIEATASAMDHGAIQPHCRRASLSVLNDTSDIISPGKAERSCKQSSGDGGIGAQLLDEGQDIIQKSAKASSANNDEVKDEARVPVIQQKGRFKVTSENVDLEKVAPSPILHKSHSMQVGNLKVMGQHPTNSLPPPSDTLSTHVFARALFPLLQSFLQTNTTQRESILNLMKQISSGEFSGDGICTPANMAAAEKSVLETAHDREKELLYEITELQWRLICAQEELQKLKSENAQVNP